MYVVERITYSLFDKTKTDKIFVPSILCAIRYIECNEGTYHSDDYSDDIAKTSIDFWKRIYYKISKANKSDLSYRCVSPELQTINELPYERQNSYASMNPFVTMKTILSETMMNTWPAYWEDL